MLAQRGDESDDENKDFLAQSNNQNDMDGTSQKEDKHQEEIDELQAKLSDLKNELNLSEDEFEKRLLKRLEHEIKFNQDQLEKDLRVEVAQEKKRIIQAAVSHSFIYLMSYKQTLLFVLGSREEHPQVGKHQVAKRDSKA